MVKTHRHILPALVLVAACSGDDNVQLDMIGTPHSAFGINFMVPAARSFTVTNQKIELDTHAINRTSDNIQIFIDENVPPVSPEGIVVDEGLLPAPYTVLKGSVGSDGVNYILHTHKSVGQKTLQVIATVKAESDQPCFTEAWAVWSSLAPSD